jgi:hypothetical protein
VKQVPPTILLAQTPTGWQATLEDRVHRSDHLAILDAKLTALYEDLDFLYRVRTGDAELDALVEKIQSARWVGRYQLLDWTIKALQSPAIPKSNRDAAVLVAVSHQRVNQLRKEMRQDPELHAPPAQILR